ncbi:phospholipase A2 Scol/Pla-like [Leguminivora glycinivorella]|uniref:phospholipase A2 Scol/Pla-like n=1 Tax=Leguminivora glycinivorella TaxID=1035111 RepID=UPI002010B7E1|nr:phospholipase A2 Scol/Pla-like [Leguminivora glycinivorella]
MHSNDGSLSIHSYIDCNTFNCTDTAPSSVSPNSPTALAAYEKGKRDRKRNAFNLYYMIEECTKCSAWDLLGYGNYCGFGGSGTPIDNIDRCCQKHDHCYDDVLNQNDCWRINIYLMPYDWKVLDGSPYCGNESNKCRREICQCDKELTECLNRIGCP